MTRTSYDDWPCAVARTLHVINDAWSVLILREVFYGVRRFDEIQAALEISRNVLTRRLNHLVDEDVLARRRYQERPPRDEYVPTARGKALMQVLLAMLRFGDDWLSPKGTLVELRDVETGAPIRPQVVDETTGQPIRLSRVRVSPGPGFPRGLLRDPSVRQRFQPRDPG